MVGPTSWLKSSARKLRRHAERVLSLDVVRYQGLQLPPSYLRACGQEFRNDANFVETARADARKLVEDFGVQQTTRLLEIGCGAGRFPIGLLAEKIRIGTYDGVDINPTTTQWCKKYIERESANFKFHLIDAAHERYNPDGTPMDDTFSLPFKDRSFDIIYLQSVFANMNPNDILIYCKEMNRILTDFGRVYLTAFIEENVNPYEVNPKDYIIESNGPLNVARYSRDNFYAIGHLEKPHCEPYMPPFPMNACESKREQTGIKSTSIGSQFPTAEVFRGVRLCKAPDWPSNCSNTEAASAVKAFCTFAAHNQRIARAGFRMSRNFRPPRVERTWPSE